MLAAICVKSPFSHNAWFGFGFIWHLPDEEAAPRAWDGAWGRPWKMRLDCVRPGFHALEERRRQVALAGVGEHRENDAAAGSLGRDFERSGERAAGRDPAEDALALREIARAADRLVVRDRDHVVVDVAIEHRGDEVGCPPLDLVRLPFLALEEGRARRLARDDSRLRARALDHLPRAGERSAGPPAGDPILEPLAREAVSAAGVRTTFAP